MSRDELVALLDRRNTADRSASPRLGPISVSDVHHALAYQRGKALDFCGAAGLMEICMRGKRGPILTDAGARLLQDLHK